MQKKSEEKLKALAQGILTLKADADINLLKTETRQLYEELCVLEYLSKVPKQVQEADVEAAMPDVTPTVKAVEPTAKTETEVEHFSLFSIEEEMGVGPDFEDIFVKKETETFIQITTETTDTPSTLNAKIEAAKQAESIIQNKGTVSNAIDETIQSRIHKSLNDKINQNYISVDLNDRIAFVKHLFDNSQEDFNRVLSQLNSFESEQEAKDFLLTQVKPDYSWDGKDSYESRLIFLIERKFM